MKKRDFNIYEKVMLIGSLIGIVGGFLNLYSVKYISGEAEKIGSMVSLDGAYLLIPLVAVIILVIMNLDQLALLASGINFAFIGYTLMLSNVEQLSTVTSTVSKGLGWYVCVLSAIAVLAGAIINFKMKYMSKKDI